MKKLAITAAIIAMFPGFVQPEFPKAFANTNAAATLWICATAQQNDLLQAGFAGLTWVQIASVGSHGETGSSTNILTYDTWDTAVIQKAKGMTDAGSPEIELARLPYDPGQIILRAAAKTNLNYAFKIVKNDPGNVGGTGTIIYNRGLVTGPKRPLGRNEDFDLEIFTLGLQQVEVVVDPTTVGNPPLNTVAPAITGTATVGQTLTLSNGTFTGDATITYAKQWFRGGVAIPGANGGTYVLVSADLGKIIQGQVYATNSVGAAVGWSAPTAAVS